MQTKKLSVIVRLTDGNWACCEFTSDKPWVPLHPDITIRDDALPLRFHQLQFQDANGAKFQEIP